MGVYLQGQKIGWANFESESATLNGTEVKKRTSRTFISTALLGDALKIEIFSTSFLDDKLRPIQSHFKMSSAGTELDVRASFFPDRIEAVMSSSGGDSKKTIPVPADAILVDDPLNDLINARDGTPMAKRKVHVFAPESLELVEILISGVERVKEDEQGRAVDLFKVTVEDPRAPMNIFFTAKGDLVKMVGPMGMEFRPEPEDIAKSPSVGKPIDLANASRIIPQGQFPKQSNKLILRIEGGGLKALLSDWNQIVSRDEQGWLVTLLPSHKANREAKIGEHDASFEKWLGDDVRVPATDDSIRKLVKEIVGDEKRIAVAAEKITDWIYANMGVNAGIGVLRDAREILKKPEGVCRDHAVLAGTLLRSAGIPTRFVNGLIYESDAYYYHAWVEYWDGSNWIGLDTTRPSDHLSVRYLKTSQGTVGEALTNFLLDGVRIKVVETHEN